MPSVLELMSAIPPIVCLVSQTAAGKNVLKDVFSHNHINKLLGNVKLITHWHSCILAFFNLGWEEEAQLLDSQSLLL